MKSDWMNNLRKYRKLLTKYRIQVLCVGAGFLLFLLASSLTPGIESISSISRKGYGSAKKEYVYVEGLLPEEVELEVPVSGRRFSDEEIGKAFGDCASELCAQILGDNASLYEVCGNLDFPDVSKKYGFRLTWIPRDPHLITAVGEVKNSDLEDPAETEIRVHMSDGERESDYVIPVRVVPEKLDEEQARIKRLKKMLVREDTENVTEAGFPLPADFEGQRIIFRNREKPNYHFIWIIGILAAVLVYVHGREELKEAREKSTRQMQLDYPEIISKLLVFVGAGMTVRAAWDAVAADYEKEMTGKKESEKREAYEEICRANERLKSGAPEGKVYRDFGRACRSRQYMKLASLLEQNRKTGVANMKAILELEMAEAWEERKNAARRAGEEASTKLLLPLFMMLGVVMVMIMVPAFMSF